MAFRPLQRALVDNRTGKLLGNTAVLDANYWRRHARQPVQFAESVNTLSELGCKVLLEVGPQPVLTAMAMRAWPEGPATPKAIASLRKDAPDSRQTIEALAQLYVAGAKPNFHALDDHLSRRKLDLPTYPFQRKTYWFTATRVPEDSHLSPQTNVGIRQGSSNGAGLFDEPEPAVALATDADAWLVATEPADREARLAEFLRAELARAMGREVDEIDMHAHFVTMGMDSLMATELRGKLQASLGIPIPATLLIYSYPNVSSLATGLLDLWTQSHDDATARHSIEIRSEEIGPGPGAIRIEAVPVRDTWLEITVSDTGPGFSDEALARGLDPFFTTKGGEGSGLGLSMVYDLTTLAGGRVLLANTAHGAEVTLRLPLRVASETSAPRLVLLVEDSAEIRQSVREMLIELGHAVIEAESAEEAERLADIPGIDLVLSDITLPGTRTGLDLIETLSARGLATRLMSSLPPGNPLRDRAAGRAALLAKPFTRIELAAFLVGAP
jgi:CheY-like chemotaxis protein